MTRAERAKTAAAWLSLLLGIAAITATLCGVALP